MLIRSTEQRVGLSPHQCRQSGYLRQEQLVQRNFRLNLVSSANMPGFELGGSVYRGNWLDITIPCYV